LSRCWQIGQDETLRALAELSERLSHVGHIRLFLDYDGTLADFAPTPDVVEPNPEVIRLLTRLKQSARLRIAIISGRALGQIQELIPVAGLLLAGTYGIEIQTESGAIIHRLSMAAIRPSLEALKPGWETCITGRKGYFLEDKGWALALHARFAADEEAGQVLATARRLASGLPGTEYRVIEGYKFLEVGPILANKGRFVEYALAQGDLSDEVPVYLGDDARDEEAFAVVAARGGECVIVSRAPAHTRAGYCLSSPQAVRQWLETLAA
jgi:trehalose 6-phosphate phosphatase